MLNESRNVEKGRVHKDCRYPERYTSSTVKGTEHQVISFITGLVVALQPDYVLETGTYKGDTALAISKELSRMKHEAHLYTLEFDAGLAREASGRLRGLPATVIPTDAHVWEPDEGVMFDFAFFDTDGKRVLAGQAERFLKWMRPGSIFCVHDTGSQWPTQEHLNEMQDRGLIKNVRLPTPRGITICEVIGEQDA